MRLERAIACGLMLLVAPAVAPADSPSGDPERVPRPFPSRGDPDRALARGATEASQAAVGRALRWLAAHQSPDGGWSAAGFDQWCDGKPAEDGRRPDGQGNPAYDPGVTGLALCAFLGAGHTDRGDHPFAKVVGKGLRYLESIQDPEGCFGPRTTHRFVYNHATAALAMVEAYGMTRSPPFQASAQRALDFVAAARNPYFGWRYAIRSGDNDTSVTGWMAMVLASAARVNQEAKDHGDAQPFSVDPEWLDGVRAWFDKVTDPDSGRVGYTQRGSTPMRSAEQTSRFPPRRSECPTAVAVWTRLRMGEVPTHPTLRKGIALLEALPPSWNPGDGSIDLCYWHDGALAMHQVGGPAWTRWNEALQRALLGAQRKDADPCRFEGSWDPIDPWGPDGGRVYATARGALCLETPTRYERVFADK